ncbi:hypothetical protein [Streptomyces sp. NPDC003015]
MLRAQVAADPDLPRGAELVGELNLDWDAYPIPGASGPVLAVLTAEDSSPDTERLRLLSRLLDTQEPGVESAYQRPL